MGISEGLREEKACPPKKWANHNKGGPAGEEQNHKRGVLHKLQYKMLSAALIVYFQAITTHPLL
jgi:hypothetical protein